MEVVGRVGKRRFRSDILREHNFLTKDGKNNYEERLYEKGFKM